MTYMTCNALHLSHAQHTATSSINNQERMKA